VPCGIHSAQIIQGACVGDECADFAGLRAVEGREAGQPLHDSIDGLGHQINDGLVVASFVLYLGCAVRSDDGSVRTTFIIRGGLAVPGYHLVSQDCPQQGLNFEIGVRKAPCGGDHGCGERADHPDVEDELGNVGGQSERDGAVGVQVTISVNVKFEIGDIK
jgi:hypothetical protein